MGCEILVLDNNDVFFRQLQLASQNKANLHFFQEASHFLSYATKFETSIAYLFVSASTYARMDSPLLDNIKQTFSKRTAVLVDEHERNSALPNPIRRGVSYVELQRHLAPIIDSFNTPAQPISTETTEFIQIKASEFVSGSQSVFDVYVKLSKDKYVKILHAGDAFLPHKVNEYIGRGVAHFYIPRESHKAYLQLSQRIASAVLKKSGQSMEVKATMTLKHGEEVLNHLEAFGCSAELLGYGKLYVENLQVLLRETQSTAKQDAFQKFISNVAAVEHGTGVSVIARILAKELGLCTDNSFKTVGLAALFHDVAMLELGISEEDYESRKNDPKWLALYHSHPERSSKILEKMGGVNPVVLQAVQQHHMRSKGRGFPARLPGTVTHKLSEIIGLADEFALLIRKYGSESPEKIQSLLEEVVFHGFSLSTVAAFKRVFLSRTT